MIVTVSRLEMGNVGEKQSNGYVLARVNVPQTTTNTSKKVETKPHYLGCGNQGKYFNSRNAKTT